MATYIKGTPISIPITLVDTYLYIFKITELVLTIFAG